MASSFDDNTLDTTATSSEAPALDQALDILETSSAATAPSEEDVALKNFKDCNTAECPVLAAVDVIGGKWKLQIMWNLNAGPMRYGQLKKSLAGISEKMLIQQLRQLEKEGLVSRHMYPEVPPRVEYSLTEPAVKLGDVLLGLHEWSKVYLMPKLKKRNEIQ